MFTKTSKVHVNTSLSYVMSANNADVLDVGVNGSLKLIDLGKF